MYWHDGLDSMGFNVEEEREEDREDGKGGEDKGVRPW